MVMVDFHHRNHSLDIDKEDGGGGGEGEVGVWGLRRKKDCLLACLRPDEEIENGREGNRVVD